jgi:hypothetical protein
MDRRTHYAGEKERDSTGSLSAQGHSAWHPPPIWRRLLVPADLTLARLHNVLQVAMGWHDSHLHEFSAGERRFGQPDPDGQLMGGAAVESERTAQLSDLLGTGSNVIYTYDFGDSWEHSIVLEKRLPADPNTTYPICTDGKLACPPEDCGGVPGFYDFAGGPRRPQARTAQRNARLDRQGFDPQAFSVDKVNKMLALLSRRRR